MRSRMLNRKKERERRDKGKGERRRNRDGDILGSDIQSKTVNIGLAQGILKRCNASSISNRNKKQGK